VAGINLDGTLPSGKARDMVVVGSGASELEDVFADVLKAQNRVITPDPEPEKGYFYRSDHISLAKVGVPMLDPGGGFDLVNGGTKAGQAVRDDYDARRYHQPTDEFDPNWDLSGPLDDVNAFYALGRKLTDSEVKPNWYTGNEFRSVRDASLSGK
jgi:Zn-dependent M28 family amino/carboxypeptidase